MYQSHARIVFLVEKVWMGCNDMNLIGIQTWLPHRIIGKWHYI